MTNVLKTNPKPIMIASAIVMSVVLAGPSAAMHARSASPLAGAIAVKTYVYKPSGTPVGYVERTASRQWWASDAYNSRIFANSRGGFTILEGHTVAGGASPRPAGQRSRYVVAGSKFLIVRALVSATRWDILNGSRLVGFTKGPDGVAAALAFIQWGDQMLPD